MPPRSPRQILDHADELADRLDRDDIDTLSGPHDATTLRGLAEAVIASARAEAAVTDAVAAARADGHPWSAIALYLGTSTQGAQQRYGPQLTGFAALHRHPSDLHEHRTVVDTREEAEALLDRLAAGDEQPFELQSITDRSTGVSWVRTRAGDAFAKA